jgi:hypothetical protein
MEQKQGQGHKVEGIAVGCVVGWWEGSSLFELVWTNKNK